MSQLSSEQRMEDESASFTPISQRNVLAGLVSCIVHLLALIALGLWALPDDSKPSLLLTMIPGEAAEGPDLESLEIDETPLEVVEEASTVPEIMDEPVMTNFEHELDPMPALTAVPDGTEPSLPAAEKFGSALTSAKFQTLSFSDKVQYFNERGLDLVIVFDATGSMSPEINNVKVMMNRMGERLLKKLSSIKISLVAYRDAGDAYTHLGTPLTHDLDKLNHFMSGIRAEGGGDMPEGVQYGMQCGLTQNKFRKRAHKLMLVFGDAPPHQEHLEDCVNIARTFYGQDGGRVNTITCGAEEPLPEFMRIAKAGHGEALTMEQRGLIFQEILVLVFGTEHREDVSEFFDLEMPPNL